ncbi:MAG: class I SAM-dependent methyltransferase, partial [Chloroflexi bacterium]|nr:class I SAM-dependent methyltransferase [Chloroflexota bacterium]
MSKVSELTGEIFNVVDRALFSVGLEKVLYGMGEKYYESVIELADIKERYRVLDVGCGTGTLAICERSKVGDGGYVAGIDSSVEILGLAREKATKENVDIDFKIGSIEEIPYEDDFFDVVTCSMVTHHLSSEGKRKGFNEIHRVLRPTGHFLLVDIGKPTSSIVKVLLKPFYPLAGSMRDNLNGRLPYLLEKAGFEQV